MKTFRLALLTGLLASVPLALHAHDNDFFRVNGSIRVAAGENAGEVSTVNGAINLEQGVTAGDVHTVNGSITIARDCVVDAVHTVNGGVRMGEGARASAVKSTNGKLTLAEGVQVSRDVSSVNGSIRLASNADVSGRLSSLNGAIDLQQAHVGGGLETVGGDINIGRDSRVEGGLLVKEASFNWFHWWFPWGRHKPEVVIAPGAVVEGTLRFEQDVELYVSDRARIGAVEGATPVIFSGEAPGRAERRAAAEQDD